MLCFSCDAKANERPHQMRLIFYAPKSGGTETGKRKRNKHKRKIRLDFFPCELFFLEISSLFLSRSRSAVFRRPIDVELSQAASQRSLYLNSSVLILASVCTQLPCKPTNNGSHKLYDKATTERCEHFPFGSTMINKAKGTRGRKERKCFE